MSAVARPQFPSDALLLSFGLTSNETRVYLALLRRGPLTPSDLAPDASVTRGRIYQVMSELERKGFVTEVPGPKRTYQATDPAVALEGAIEEQRSVVREQERLREEVLPALLGLRADRALAHPSVEVLRRAEQITQRFQQLQREVREEILVFTKAPLLSTTNPAGLESLERGVRNATIYESAILAEGRVADAIHTLVEAGEEARVLDRLPTKMAVCDRRVALLALPGGDRSSSSVPVIVHDAGLAETLAAAFDSFWSRAEPLVPDPSAR
jgi:sugar-specific transcriptional regulator TrmB